MTVACSQASLSTTTLQPQSRCQVRTILSPTNEQVGLGREMKYLGEFTLLKSLAYASSSW